MLVLISTGACRFQKPHCRRSPARRKCAHADRLPRISSSRCSCATRRLRNRIVFGAHTANMSEQGLPGERHRGYYEERARGGAAMIVVEPVPVHRTAVLTRGNFRHSTTRSFRISARSPMPCTRHGAVICHQLYHVGQHGDFDNSYEPNWSPSGLPSFHDSDGSHAMTEAEIEEIIDELRRRGAARQGSRASTASRSSPPTTRIVDQFWTPFNNRRDDRWGGSLREPHALLAGDHARASASMAGEDFIIGLAVNLDPEIEVSLSIEQMQEIIAWHDERQLMDYVTCGTGSYFDFTGIIPNVFFADKLGAPYAEALKQVVKHAKVQCGKPYPHAGECRLRRGVRARPTWCRSCAARSPIRISPTRRGRTGRRISGPASPATRCAGAGAIATTGSPASSILRPAANSNGAATASRRPSGRRRCWSSAAASPGSRRRGWRPSAAIR